MNKINTKLNFRKPSGESRLDDNSKQEIKKIETRRFSLDLPKHLSTELRIEAAKREILMKDLVLEAIIEKLKKLKS